MTLISFDEAIARVKSDIPCTNYLEPSKGGLYCCEACESGYGTNNNRPKEKADGAVEYYPKTNTWYCHKCKSGSSSIDLHMITHKCDFVTAVKEMAATLDLQIDNGYKEYSNSNQKMPAHVQTATQSPERKVPPTPEHSSLSANKEKRHENRDKVITHTQEPNADTLTPLIDYSTYYDECAARIEDPRAVAYLQSRGISISTAINRGIGFDPNWISPKAIEKLRDEGNDWTPPATERIIVPATNNSYHARAIDPTIKKEYRKMNEKGHGEMGIFNTQVLYYPRDAAFICEGAFSALSVEECGQVAIALNSTNNADKLIKLLEKKPPEVKTMIICLDNDESGKEATETLAQGFTRLNISYIIADICGAYNDPNDALIGAKEGFSALIEATVNKLASKPDLTANYIDTLFFNELERDRKSGNKMTGFKYLDEKARGLRSGLYVIAATSSLGKTTFALQMADNLAMSGNDVLFFSLEQSRLELVTKSFSRLLYQNDIAQISAIDLRRYADNKEYISIAAKQYKKAIGHNLSIIEGNFNCDISFISEYIRKYVKDNQRQPIIFIDYLQILQPSNKKAGIKESVDNNVTELRRISREHGITIVVISSVNRNNYLMPIDFESLKESGGIEYTADVVYGLQLQCIHEDIFNQKEKIAQKRERIKTAKRAEPREIELVCLKNRYGISNFTCNFDYIPRFDCFESVKEVTSQPRKAGRTI